jgi:hypothetical protein
MEKTTLKKNQTAKVQTKNGKQYSYQYIDIAQIHEYLEDNNMKYYQYIDRIDGDDYIMTVKIIDGKEQPALRGSRVVDATLFGTDNPAQQQGSALTYARRYSLLMAFGLATEDDDAQSLSRPKEVKPMTIAQAKEVVITFGKKHPNEKLVDIFKTDKGYLDWLLENDKTDENIKQAIRLVYADNNVQILTDEDKAKKLTLMGDLNELFLKTGVDRESMYKHYKVTTDGDMTIEQLEDAISKLKGKVA